MASQWVDRAVYRCLSDFYHDNTDLEAASSLSSQEQQAACQDMGNLETISSTGLLREIILSLPVSTILALRSVNRACRDLLRSCSAFRIVEKHNGAQIAQAVGLGDHWTLHDLSVALSSSCRMCGAADDIYLFLLGRKTYCYHCAFGDTSLCLTPQQHLQWDFRTEEDLTSVPKLTIPPGFYGYGDCPVSKVDQPITMYQQEGALKAARVLGLHNVSHTEYLNRYHERFIPLVLHNHNAGLFTQAIQIKHLNLI